MFAYLYPPKLSINGVYAFILAFSMLKELRIAINHNFPSLNTLADTKLAAN